MCYYCMSGRLLVAGALASRRLARPVLVAAPSGWPSASPLAARGSPPGLSGSARRRPAPPGGVFAPLLGSLGRPPASCPLACGGALAPSRPVLGFPPPRRAPARRCSPRLPPPALARLRAGPLAPPVGPPGPSVGARARPGGASLPRRVCLSLAGGPLLRRAGALGPLARASGGRVPRPRALGAVRGWLVPPIGSRQIKAKASGPLCGPALTAGAVVGYVWARAKGPNLQAGGLTSCIIRDKMVLR